MQSINELYSMINSDYRKLQSEHEMEKSVARDVLYADFPRVEEIDREISTLAITSAKRVLEEKITPDEAAAFVKSEAERLRRERSEILARNNASDYVPSYRCEKCSDTGYVDGGRKCGCYIKRLQELLALPGEKYDNVAIKNYRFENFDIRFYPKESEPELGCSPYELMRTVYAHCYKFACGFDGSYPGSLLLCGPSGLGKTFLAGCIANRVAESGHLVIYKSSYKLFQFLEDYKFGKIDRDHYSVAYDTIYDCDLLVIDDFGTEFITSYSQTVFFDLLSSRLAAEKPTVISTNLSLGKISEIYQERVMSRLLNEFTVLRFAGIDIRAQKNNR